MDIFSIFPVDMASTASSVSLDKVVETEDDDFAVCLDHALQLETPDLEEELLDAETLVPLISTKEVDSTTDPVPAEPMAPLASSAISPSALQENEEIASLPLAVAVTAEHEGDDILEAPAVTVSEDMVAPESKVCATTATTTQLPQLDWEALALPECDACLDTVVEGQAALTLSATSAVVSAPAQEEIEPTYVLPVALAVIPEPAPLTPEAPQIAATPQTAPRPETLVRTTPSPTTLPLATATSEQASLEQSDMSALATTAEGLPEIPLLTTALPEAPVVTTPARFNTHVATPLTSPGFRQDFHKTVTYLVTQNVHTARVSLTPPELGPLEIKIDYKNKQELSILVSSPYAVTKTTLEEGLPRLQQQLVESGFQQVDVNVDLSDASEYQQYLDRKDHQERRQKNPHSPFALMEQHDELLTVSTPKRSQGLVDLYG